MQLPYDPTLTFAGIYPRELTTYLQKNLYTNVFNNFIHKASAGKNSDVFQRVNA